MKIDRGAVKDLAFPANLPEIMNGVLAADRRRPLADESGSRGGIRPGGRRPERRGGSGRRLISIRTDVTRAPEGRNPRGSHTRTTLATAMYTHSPRLGS